MGKLSSSKLKAEAISEEKGRNGDKKIRSLPLTFASENTCDETLQAFHKVKKPEYDQPENRPQNQPKKRFDPKEERGRRGLYQDLIKKRRGLTKFRVTTKLTGFNETARL